MVDIHDMTCAVACEGTSKGGDQAHLIVEHTVQQVEWRRCLQGQRSFYSLFLLMSVQVFLQANQSVRTTNAALAHHVNQSCSHIACAFKLMRGHISLISSKQCLIMSTWYVFILYQLRQIISPVEAVCHVSVDCQGWQTHSIAQMVLVCSRSLL